MESHAARDLGKLYAEQALPFLVGKWGQQAELRDISSFYVSSAAWMAANGFVLVLEKAGKAEAEKFVAQVLAGMAANIRLLKAPFMASFSGELIPLEDEPMPEPKQSPPPDSAPAPEPAALAAGACKCEMVKGECRECLERLKAHYGELGTFILDYIKEFTSKTREMAGRCIPCGARYSDRILAEIAKAGIKGDLKPEEEPLRQQALGVLIQTASAFGISEIPLTSKVLEEAAGD